MIIDFHVHVLPLEDMPAFTGTGFHRNIRVPKAGGVPTTIENALEAAKIGGVDVTVISNLIQARRHAFGPGICEMIGRMDYAYRLQDEAYFLGSYEPMLINHPPAARCALDTVGVDHFIFGTDSPRLLVLKTRGRRSDQQDRADRTRRRARFTTRTRRSCSSCSPGGGAQRHRVRLRGFRFAQSSYDQ
jgi:hypothetical protein